MVQKITSVKDKHTFRLHLAVVFTFLVLIFGFISVVQPVIPLTYDEAWNFTDISRHGFLYTITHYPYPNNHVFFTALQSIFTPLAALPFLPYALRLVNSVVCSVFFLLLFVLLRTTAPKYQSLHIPILLSLFFVTPLVTTYFIVSRGYVLGSFLLFIGIYCLARKKYAIAILPLSLSAWTVPTFLYALPFVYIAVVLGNTKQHRFFIAMTGVAVAIFVFLLYIPILKYVFASTNQWTTYSFVTFFTETVRSLSNYSFLPNGWILHSLYVILYICSACAAYFQKNSSFIRRFFLSLNIAVMSYLVTIFILSELHLARPPFMRNGLFIPIVVHITIIYAALLIKRTYFRYIAGCLLVGNLLAGINLFTTQLAYTSVHPYPYLAELSPLSKPPQQLQLEIQKKLLTADQSSDEAALKYYSLLYNIPLVESIKPTAPHSTNQPTVKDSTKTTTSPVPQETKKNDSIPVILPDNIFYAGKRIWRHAKLKSYDIFVLSKKPKIRYLLGLSDETYTESLVLWNKNKRELAVQTLLKAENFVTLMTPEIHTLSNAGDRDTQLYEDIKVSIEKHMQVLSRFVSSSDDIDQSILLLIQETARNNLKTITFLIGK